MLIVPSLSLLCFYEWLLLTQAVPDLPDNLCDERIIYSGSTQYASSQEINSVSLCVCVCVCVCCHVTAGCVQYSCLCSELHTYT